MLSLTSRRVAFTAMIGGLIGASLVAAVPASAAPASHGAISSTPAKAISGGVMPTGAKVVTTEYAHAVRTSTSGRVTANSTLPGIYCSVTESAVYLLQPGTQWGPYVAWEADSTALGNAAEVTCNLPVPTIEVEADLIRGDGLALDGTSFSYSNTLESPWTYNLVPSCVENTWQSRGDATVILPPGYVSNTTGKPWLSLQIISGAYDVTADDCIPTS